MTEIILFGGTVEGRLLAELLAQKHIAALMCVATEYGEALIKPTAGLRVHTGRLDQAAIERLCQAEQPNLVIDATHPYAVAVSDNIQAACAKCGVECLRLQRQTQDAATDCTTFSSLPQLISWLNRQPGTVFSTLGAQEAAALTAIHNFAERLWLRILPDPVSLSSCLAAGFAARQIICMQGPFSQELNEAMFRAVGAQILLTKESGLAGGYPQKLAAAQACGMATAVLTRPVVAAGLTLEALAKRIEGYAI